MCPPKSSDLTKNLDTHNITAGPKPMGGLGSDRPPPRRPFVAKFCSLVGIFVIEMTNFGGF